MNQSKRKIKTQLFLVAMVLFLAACGQRGPLFLPEPKQAPVETNKTEANQTEANGTQVDETEGNETEDDGEKTPGT